MPPATCSVCPSRCRADRVRAVVVPAPLRSQQESRAGMSLQASFASSLCRNRLDQVSREIVLHVADTPADREELHFPHPLGRSGSFDHLIGEAERLRCDRLDQDGVVVVKVADARADGPASHLFRGSQNRNFEIRQVSGSRPSEIVRRSNRPHSTEAAASLAFPASFLARFRSSGSRDFRGSSR